MAGLQKNSPTPQALTVHSQSRVLEISFSDGHDTGIFSWDYLYFLGSQQDALWKEYAQRLSTAGRDRDAPMPIPEAHGCASH